MYITTNTGYVQLYRLLNYTYTRYIILQNKLFAVAFYAGGRTIIYNRIILSGTLLCPLLYSFGLPIQY